MLPLSQETDRVVVPLPHVRKVRADEIKLLAQSHRGEAFEGRP